MLRVAWLISIFVFVPVLSATAASFDCTKAKLADEIAVCADPELSALDDAAGRAYLASIRIQQRIDRNQIRGVAREFLVGRRKCGADRRCIIAAYVDVLGFYDQYGGQVDLPEWVTAQTLVDVARPLPSGTPSQVGACNLTEIREVPDKAADFGARSVLFANQLRQVYYASAAQERNILASRKGDNVIMCLTSLPRFCERSEDNRGRFYLVTNLRTKRTWWLTDSEHMCGGA
jgi:uncharacterized protein